MSLDHKKVRYKNKYYAVIYINEPVVIDLDDYMIIQNLNKKWRYNKCKFISCLHNYDDTYKEVFLHEIIMALKQKSEGERRKHYPIIHINKIGVDNRRDNLIYDTIKKDIRKNTKKKRRTIVLPRASGINPNEIPTYVWYMKANGSHGDRFQVAIDDIKWKTTSSKNVSLREKLEEAKKFLRYLRKTRPNFFENYSMNGDYTKRGKELLDSYFAILKRAGYNNIEKPILNNTKRLLKPKN